MFCNVDQYPMAVKTPGILIIRVKSALLCFANANSVRERYRIHTHTHTRKDLILANLEWLFVKDFLIFLFHFKILRKCKPNRSLPHSDMSWIRTFDLFYHFVLVKKELELRNSCITIGKNFIQFRLI